MATRLATQLQAAEATDPTCGTSAPSAQCVRWRHDIDAAVSHLINIRRNACDWHLLEEFTYVHLYRALQVPSPPFFARLGATCSQWVLYLAVFSVFVRTLRGDWRLCTSCRLTRCSSP